MVDFGELLKTEAYSQTVLPNKLILIEHKLVDYAKIEKMRYFE